MNKATKRVIRYVALPEVLPRARALFTQGFGFVAFSMACVFQTAGMLPPHHPYTRPDNIGKFGVRHVLGQTALKLRFSFKHADQLLLYVLMLSGFILLLSQIGLLGFSLFMQTAQAGGLPNSFQGFFESPDPTNDISFMLLDRIFGIPDLFNSCVAQNIPCLQQENPGAMSAGIFPQPYHIALQDLLGFYSIGLLIVATIILVYYVISIMAEMSETGTAFGKRFNRVWAPIRIVVALGLLIPMAHNLNAAQYITLYIAKYGSGFGTNAWNFFITSLALTDTNTLTGDSQKMISIPQYPVANEIVQFMSTAWTCKVAYKRMYNIDIDAYAVRTPLRSPNTIPFIDLMRGADKPYYNMQRWYDLGDVEVVFGEYNPTKHDRFKGYVRPYCGQMSMPSVRTVEPQGGPFHDGADQLSYTYLVYYVWLPWTGGPVTSGGIGFQELGETIANRTLPIGRDMSKPLPGEQAKRELVTWYNTSLQSMVDVSLREMQNKTDWAYTATAYGWAGAGIWYNKIAQANGEFTDAVFNMPTVTKYPEIMEWIRQKKLQSDSAVSGDNVFEPNIGDGSDAMDGRDPNDKAILIALNESYKLWAQFVKESKPKETGNAFVDAINALFEKTGLWSARANEAVHPLATLTSLGRSLLIKSVYAFGGGAVTGIGGAFSSLGKASLPAAVLSNMSSFLITIGYMGLISGIMLYYIVPFLPFIYFFFAVAGWAKTLFEAMVGVPLWALAHLRYDREGFPTTQAMYGYYLLLDIFLRPVLIIFGLIASIAVFYALARTLNNTFDIVTSNLAGFNKEAATAAGGPKVGEIGNLTHFRSAVDQLFFTIIYAILVYMIGMSCFKMIDLFPNNILRWMGNSAQSFSSGAQENAGEMIAGQFRTGSYQMTDAANSMLSGITNRNDYAVDQ